MSQSTTVRHDRGRLMPIRLAVAALIAVCGLQATAQVTIRYDFVRGNFSGSLSCACWNCVSELGTTSMATNALEVSYVDLVPPGATVTNVEYRVVNRTYSTNAMILRANGVDLATYPNWGGCGNFGAVTTNTTTAYVPGGTNTVSLRSQSGGWVDFGDSSGVANTILFQITVTFTPTAAIGSVWRATGTDWNTPGNWNPSAVPNSSTNAWIVRNPAGVFQTVINGTTTLSGSSMPTLSAAGAVNHLWMSAGCTLGLNANTLTINGDLRTNGTFNGNTGTTVFGGTGAATLSGAGTTTFNNLSINKTAAVTVASTHSFTVNGTFTNEGTGTFAPSAGNITCNGAITNQGSATFAPSGGTMTAANVNITNTGAAIWNASGGTLTITGGSPTSIVNNSTAASPQLTFFNLTINKNSGVPVSSTDNWQVAGDYLNTQGDMQCSAGTVTLAGTGARTLTIDGGTVQFNNLTINQTGGTRTWTNNTNLLTLLSTLENAGAGNFTVTPAWTITGTNSIVLRNSGAGATTFSSDLILNKSAAAATVTTEVTAGSMTVNGNFTNTGSGTFGTTSGTFSVNGNLDQSSAAVISCTGGTFRFGGAGASTITNTSTGGITFFNFTIDKTAAVNVTTTNSFTVLGTFTNSGAGSFVANQGVETPWQTFQNGTLITGDGLDYTMGYRFTILVNGRITRLGGRFAGTKTITLYNATTQAVVAQASVNGVATGFTYSSIPPVNVSVGEQYTISVYLGGTGGTHRENINTLPRTYGAITIEDSRYSIGNVYPTTVDLTAMWGQVDIEMQALPTLTMAGSGAGAINHSSSGTTTFANLTVNKPTGVNVGSTTNWNVTGNVRSVGAGTLLCTGGTVTLNGTSQIIDGATAPQFNNLTVGAGSTITPTSNVNVLGTLLVAGTWRMTGPQTLTLGSASGGGTMTVNGTLNCSGSTPTIQGFDTTNRATVDVNGSINVSALNFRRGTANGLNLVAGSTVVALNNVNFTEAISGAGNRHLSINNSVVGTFSGCSFDNSFGAGNNVVMNNASANVTMATWSGAGGGPAFHNIVAGTLSWQSSPPSAPTNLLAEQTTNPINVLDSRPEFSARHSDPDTDSANAYWIQVTTDSTFATVTHWDSGWLTLTPNLANNTQMTDRDYGGSFMTWATQYFWRIRFRDTNNVTGNWSAGASFTLGVPSVTLPTNGWNMVTVPRFDNASVASVFGDDIPGVVVYEWNETARSYQQTLTIQPGRGYLIFSPASFVDTDTGIARWGNLTISNLGYTTLTQATQYETAANQFRGWHVIGHPFNPSANWTTIWAGSTNLGDTYFWWDGTSYQWCDANPFTESTPGMNAVPAWRGIWINVTAPTNTIVLPNPKNPPEPGEPPFDANYWRLQVRVDSGGSADTSNFAGVRGSSSDGFDSGDVKDFGTLANPYGMAYFNHRDDWTTAPDLYTQQMNQTPFNAGAVSRFPLTVEQNTGTDVTLSFPNFAQMPSTDWSYQLQDMDTMQLYPISNGFTYTYSPGGAGTKRFDVVATRLTGFSSALNCSTGPQNPAAGQVGASEGGVVMLQLRMAAVNEWVTVDQLRIRTSGSGNDATMIAAARLYHDVDRDGNVGPGDTLIAGPNTFSMDDGNVLWWNLDWGIPVNGFEDWLVVFDFDGVGTEGGTFRAWFDPVTDVQARGQSSQLLILGSGGVVSGPSKTMMDGNPPGAPLLAAPSDGSSVPNGGPSFDWSDVLDAQSYAIQVDNAPDFSAPEVNQGGLATSSYTQGTTLPMGTYFWRVSAVDDGGNLGPWSETWSFAVAPASRSELAVGLGSGGGALFANFDDNLATNAFRGWKRVPWSAYGADDGGGQTRPAQGDVDGDGLDEIVVGLDRQGAGWLPILRGMAGNYALVRWIRVPWSAYNSANGATWAACGSVDNDPRAEIVVGLDSYPQTGGWMVVFDDAQANYAVLGWRRLAWGTYNLADGQVRPATGDVDGDGRDEVVLGLGPASRGRIPVLEDWSGGMGTRAWIQIPWAAYNSTNGSTWVAAGDTDGDGRAEVVVGLGNGGGGWFGPFEDASSGHAFQGWQRVPWSAYNAGRGETRPAIGNADADAREELYLGLGPTGSGFFASCGDGQEGYAFRAWRRVPWGGYNTANGETWPSVGNGESD